MRLLFTLLLATLFTPQAASAQGADDWILSQRDKEVIGIVEVRTGSPGSSLDTIEPERGTGTIVSAAGHVLTAAHLFTDESYAICTAAAGAPPDKVCQISFLWRGDPANRFALTVSGGRPQERDYVLLRLPAAADKIGRPGWPVAALARKASDGEAIYAAGYRASDPARWGAANAIDTARGTLRADMSGSCSNSYGIARNATMQTSPGLSGGPTFNTRHRVVGIVLGEACSDDGGGNFQDSPKSRILLVQDMDHLCDKPGLPCFFGYDGDIDTVAAGETSPWYKRLVGGESVADNYAYGVKIREIAKLGNLLMLCPQLMSDAELVQSVQRDADGGGELATVFDTVWAVCKPGANPIDSLPSRQRLQRLADTGYEPAQQLAALMVLFELGPKLASRHTPDDPLMISPSDREQLGRAEGFLRAAAAHEWTAASMTMFELCRTRVLGCTEVETEHYLDAALADGQREALRSAGLLYLIGKDPVFAPMNGIARDEDFNRALALFQQAATPQPGATKNPGFLLYDNLAAGYLAYFYWGGLYRGKQLVSANAVLAQQYSGGCNAAGPAVPQLFEFCGMIDAVGQFNNSADSIKRQAAWSFIQGYAPWALIAGPLAHNLASWTQDGRDIDRIDCPLNEQLLFVAPAAPPTFKPRTAYCYFRNPDSE